MFNRRLLQFETQQPTHQSMLEQLINLKYRPTSFMLTDQGATFVSKGQPMIAKIVTNFDQGDIPCIEHPNILAVERFSLASFYDDMDDIGTVAVYKKLPTLADTSVRKWTETECKQMIVDVLSALKELKNKGMKGFNGLTPELIFVDMTSNSKYCFKLGVYGFGRAKDYKEPQERTMSFKSALMSLAATAVFMKTHDENIALKCRFFDDATMKERLKQCGFSRDFISILLKLFGVFEISEILDEINGEKKLDPAWCSSPVSKSPGFSMKPVSPFPGSDEQLTLPSQIKLLDMKHLSVKGQTFQFNDIKEFSYDDENLLEDDQFRMILQEVCPGFKESRTIGKGGFGSVYLVQLSSPPKEVAVKFVMFVEDNSPQQVFTKRKEVARECDKRFDHPHILKVFDSHEVIVSTEESLSTHYMLIATEFFKKGELMKLCGKCSHYLSNKAKSNNVEVVCWKMLKQLCEALEFMYSRNHFIHRDIKPQNILVRDFSLEKKIVSVVIADFGLTRSMDTMLTQSNNAGSATFMAPELRNNFNGANRYSTASDIYALGITMLLFIFGTVDENLENERGRDHLKKKLDDAYFSSEFVNVILSVTAPEVQDRMTYAQILKKANNHLHEINEQESKGCLVFVDDEKRNLKKGMTFEINSIESDGSAVYCQLNERDEIKIPKNILVGPGSLLQARTRFCSFTKAQNLLNVSMGDQVVVHSVSKEGWLFCTKKNSEEKGYIYYDILDPVMEDNK